jgi:hypothetical protein
MRLSWSGPAGNTGSPAQSPYWRVRYRHVGLTQWNVVDGAANPLTLNNLWTSHQYEWDLRYIDGSPCTTAVASTFYVGCLPWRNNAKPFDVNRDGNITALDAQLIIAELNNRTPHYYTPNNVLTACRPDPAPSFDVNGDGNVTPNDALQIISYLNTRKEGTADDELNIGPLASVSDISVDVFPNPATNNCSVLVQGGSNANLNLTLCDALGRVIMTESFRVLSGQDAYNLDLSNILEGVYIVSVTNGISTTFQKLVVSQ